MSDPRATVIIPTRNRREELAGALRSCLAQSVRPQVVVHDDGSTDGTWEMLGAEFAWVERVRSDPPVGSVGGRNRCVALARAPVIITIDDDAVFPTPGVVEGALRDFDHPRVGAVALPYVDVKYGPEVKQLNPPGPTLAVASFRGCAAAIRAELWRSLGGYSEVLGHHCEEPEFCMRLWGAGYAVRLGTGEPTHHFESPRRASDRLKYLMGRNNLLMGYANAPLAMLPVHVLGCSYNVLRWGRREGGAGLVARGLGNAYWTCLTRRGLRKPMPRRAYDLYRRLLTRGPMPLEEALAALGVAGVAGAASRG